MMMIMIMMMMMMMMTFESQGKIIRFSGVYVNDDIGEMVDDENEGCLLTIDMGGNNF